MKSGLKDLKMSHHFVAFLDLLGQGAFLRQLATIGMPHDPTEKRAVADLLRKTAVNVINLRDAFGYFFDAFEAPAQMANTLAPGDRDRFERMRRVPVRTRGFSDSLVISAPLVDSQEFGRWHPVSAVSRCLVGIGGIANMALSLGFAFRGAIVVGVGVEIFDDEYYGPALDEAYRLESQVADYPRIVVSETVRDYLRSPVPPIQTAALVPAAKNWADRCLAMIIDDRDGTAMLDFIGPGMKAAGDGLDPKDVRRAYDRIQENLQRFRDAGDVKLANRYERLKAYFDSRLSLWPPT